MRLQRCIILHRGTSRGAHTPLQSRKHQPRNVWQAFNQPEAWKNWATPLCHNPIWRCKHLRPHYASYVSCDQESQWNIPPANPMGAAIHQSEAPARHMSSVTTMTILSRPQYFRPYLQEGHKPLPIMDWYLISGMRFLYELTQCTFLAT